MLGIFLIKSIYLLQIIRIAEVTAETILGKRIFESSPFETRTSSGHVRLLYFYEIELIEDADSQ